MLFVAKPAILYDDPTTYDATDLSDFDVGAGRHIPVVESFTYLGTVISRNCNDAMDVDTRLKKASAAFGALRGCVFASRTVSPRAKRTVYVGLVLAILLHGAESWCLTEEMFNRLRQFHLQCARAMCRISRTQTWLYHISTSTLLKRLGLETIDTYISRRQLRWAGHVARMEWYRFPRRMLSSWCASKRPRGSPQFTYGRGLKKALRKYNIPLDSWHDLAQDRDAWRQKISSSPTPPSATPVGMPCDPGPARYGVGISLCSPVRSWFRVS